MGKPKSYEEAQEARQAAQEAAKELRTELAAFCKENKIKRGTAPDELGDDVKASVAKKYKTLFNKNEKAREAVADAKATEKELKPRKERASKYDYPDDVTTPEQKKKYRAKMRREAKAAEKGDDKKSSKKSSSKKSSSKGGKKTSKKTSKKEAATDGDD